MKKRLSKLSKKQLEQMYYHFFNYCRGGIDFMQFVPKIYLINKIISEICEHEIEDYFNDTNCLSNF